MVQIQSQFDAKAIINLLLLLVTIASFVFAIWSYIKTGSIKNSLSPSIPYGPKSNNTFVNTVASAPNLVKLNLSSGSSLYTPQSIDNGMTLLLTSILDNQSMIFTLPNGGVKDSNKNVINGYYFKILNGNPSGGKSIEIYSGSTLECTLAPGGYMYYSQNISNLLTPESVSSGWYCIA